MPAGYSLQEELKPPMDAQTTPMTAVVADDEAEIRDLIAEYLVRLGYQVTQAGDGFEALLHVRDLRPTLLILDLMMPRLGGIDAFDHIRRTFPNVVDIVVTGTMDDALRGRAVGLGAAALLPKPLDLDILGTIISTVVPRSVETAPAANSPAAATPSPSAAAPVRVLVVDDEADIRDVLGEFVEHRGYQALLAPDGLSALRMIIDEQPDVVLLDIEMPRLGGMEALTAIRAIVRQTAVIMVSGIDSVELARQALLHGAFDYVRKPADFEYLERSLDTAVRLRSLTA